MALMGKFNAMKHAVGDSELPSRLSHLSEEDEALKGAMEQVRAGENDALYTNAAAIHPLTALIPLVVPPSLSLLRCTSE